VSFFGLSLLQEIPLQKLTIERTKGMYVTTSISNLYLESMLALYLNFVLAMPPPLTKSPLGFLRFLTTHILNLYTPQEQEAAMKYQENGSYYLHIIRTRPQAVRAMLADSLVALLDWICEKRIGWTDGYPWTNQEICARASLYWFSRAGPAASVTIHHEIWIPR
jgi:hypothetical protein